MQSGFFVAAVSGLRINPKKYVLPKEKRKKGTRVPATFSEMIIFSGIIDHTAQQHNLFHLKSLSALQFICRGTILGGENEMAM